MFVTTQGVYMYIPRGHNNRFYTMLITGRTPFMKRNEVCRMSFFLQIQLKNSNRHFRHPFGVHAVFITTVLAISNIIVGVSTLFLGVIIGVTVTSCIKRNSSSQHEQPVSTNVSSDRPMYEEITTTKVSKEKFKMEKNGA